MARNLSVLERNPSIGEICLTVAWASLYAREPLDESHPLWATFHVCSEWFRHSICAHLKLPMETEWEQLHRRAGQLVQEEYPNREAFVEAYDFGMNQQLDNELAPAMFTELERIKLQIVGRY